MAAAKKAAATAVEARGEISIELEGVSYTLTPSFQAIGEIETACGKSLWELARAAEARTLTLSDCGEIVAACIRANARANDDRDMATIKAASIAKLIYGEVGGLFAAVTVVIDPLLRLALMGGYTSEGFRRP